MRKFLVPLVISLAIVMASLGVQAVTAPPAAAATYSTSVFCGLNPAYTVWADVNFHYYTGPNGAQRVQIDSVALRITAPAGRTITAEFRVRFWGGGGVLLWDTGYTAPVGPQTTPSWFISAVAGSSVNSQTSTDPHMTVDGGAYNDGYAACPQNYVW